MNRFQLLCVFMAVKLKQGSSMPPERCNKCKEGIADPGDSWCTGCSSLELCQTLLKRPWEHPGIRKVAEESILGAARLCKAFSNLDRGLLASAAQGPPGVTPKASGARPRSRSPKRDRRPPLQRAPTPPAPPTRSARREPEDYPTGVSPGSYEEESEEERREEEPRREERREVKEERTEGGSRRPPGPPGPPPVRRDEREHSQKRRGKKKRKKTKRRGGAKHQRHYREVANPLKRSHRKISQDRLQLAGSFKEGLTRRA